MYPSFLDFGHLDRFLDPRWADLVGPLYMSKKREQPIPSWYYPWLKWTFSDLPEDEYNDNVSFCMDMFGYSYYISLLISPLPGILITIIKKCIGGTKGIRVDIDRWDGFETELGQKPSEIVPSLHRMFLVIHRM